MIFRILLILGCMLVFINGCNSLISGIAGTHKLRVLSLTEVRHNGLGDADFVEIEGAWSSGDYIFEPHRNKSWPGFIQWPVLDRLQLDSIENGMQVTVGMVAWTRKYNRDCINAQDCVGKGAIPLKGLVRSLNPRFNKSRDLSAQKYVLSEEVVYIESNRQPLAWYWNILIMFGAVSVVVLLERRTAQREK